MPLDLLSCMKSFAAVADYKGFANAARHIHISTPVLTKQIQWLERSLGKKLLQRTTRRLELTEAGKIYLEHVKKILQQVHQAKDEVLNLDHEPHGTLTIGIPTAFNSMFLTKQFHKFLDKYPKITLKVITENSPITLLEDIINIVISPINIFDKQLIKKHFFTNRRGVFAAPAYLKKYGTPKKISDLKNHNCLVNERVSPNHEWEFAKHRKISVRGNYVSDSGIDIIYAGINGIGIIWTTDLLVREEVLTKQLVPIKLEFEPAAIEFFLYHRPAIYSSNVRLLTEYLLQTTCVSFKDFK